MIAICIILGMQVLVRPVLFFLGLDRPSPYAWFSGPEWDLVAQANLYATVWFLVTASTYLLLCQTDRSGFGFPRTPPQVSVRSVLLIAAALTALNAFATLFLVWQAGGVAQFVFAVKIGKKLAGFYVLREIGTLAVTLLIYALVAEAGARRRGLAPRHSLLLIAGMIAVDFGINYLWGNRSNIAYMTLAGGVAFHLHVRRFRIFELVIGAVVFLTLLEGLKELRNAFVSQVTGRAAGNDFDFWLRLSASLHLNQFDALMLALRDVGERFDFRNGQDALNGLLAWVPRAIWTDKETFQVGGWFRRVYQSNTINGWPITVVGNWYINFGLIGIALGGMLSGVVAAIMDWSFSHPRHNAWAAGIGSSVSFQLLNGGVDFGFAQSYVLLVVPLFLLVPFLARRKPRRAILAGGSA